MRRLQGFPLLIAMLALTLLTSASTTIAAPSDYLFGFGFGTCYCDNGPGYLYRFDNNGNMIWERALPYTQFSYMNDHRMADRNLKEDALYWLLGGAANLVNGKMRLQKYDAAGDLDWELPLLTPAGDFHFGVVSANPVLGGVYVADPVNNGGIYRIDGAGNIVWGPSTLGFPGGVGAINWSVCADVTTGGGYATRSDATALGTVIRFDPNGVVLWSVTTSMPHRLTSNPVDGGVYVGADGYSMNTYRLGPEGDIKWMKSCVPSCYNYTRGVSPLDGSLVLQGGWPHDISRIGMDGTVQWTHNHYGLGAPTSLAFDLHEDALYTSRTEDVAYRGYTKHRGSDFSQLWFVPAPHGEFWCLAFMGLPSMLETPPVAVEFDLTPNALNPTSRGRWVTGFLEPPPPFSASDIDVSSIRLNGTVPVDRAAPIAIGDHDGDAIPDLMVKFSRGAVELGLPEGGDVDVGVTGTVDGQSFAGTDLIRVVRGSVSAPLAGSHVAAGSVTQIRWQIPGGVTVESVALLQSIDGGTTYSLIARGQPNTGTYDWAVPNVRTDQAKVAVVLESTVGTSYAVDGVIAVSKAFFVDALVGVGDGGALQFALDRIGPNPTRGDQVRVEFVLAQEGSATLELFDVAGRRVIARDVGTLGVGRHQVDLASGQRLTPGLYMLRLTQGTQTRVGRVAVIE